MRALDNFNSDIRNILSIFNNNKINSIVLTISNKMYFLNH